jgi:hypothetical protein
MRKTNSNAKTPSTPTLTVFGTRPVDAIYLPDIPFSIRLNCKDGGIFIGGQEAKHRRSNPEDRFEINIIKVSKFFGDLGKTKGEMWIQLFFVAAPSVPTTVLPKNTVCVTYIKKQSIADLYSTVQDAMNHGEPAMGIFTVGFDKHLGEKGTYYSITFDWRERETDEEKAQLEQIANFLSVNQSRLVDLDGTRDMVCIDDYSAEQINKLLVGTQTSSPEIESSDNNNQRRLTAGR